MEHDFMGKDGQEPPHMDDAFLGTVTSRYVELFEKVTGKPFEATNTPILTPVWPKP